MVQRSARRLGTWALAEWILARVVPQFVKAIDGRDLGDMPPLMRRIVQREEQRLIRLRKRRSRRFSASAPETDSVLDRPLADKPEGGWTPDESYGDPRERMTVRINDPDMVAVINDVLAELANRGLDPAQLQTLVTEILFQSEAVDSVRWQATAPKCGKAASTLRERVKAAFAAACRRHGIPVPGDRPRRTKTPAPYSREAIIDEMCPPAKDGPNACDPVAEYRPSGTCGRISPQA
ncbi:MAG: hypothetical protein U1A27_11130 [Phycisphaerae bacterium]